MPTLAVGSWARRRGMELLLAAVAGAVFLGYLGAVDLWGKREQRASAEALDTVDHKNWLIAQIQGRPRLEKPPLPRWTIATLITLTGRRDEWIVRLPSALAAIGTVGLVYGLGRRLGGRAVGLSAGLVLTSLGFFISELRQAGNDGPLAFFTTLALYAAWRRLHGGTVDEESGDVLAFNRDSPSTAPVPGGRVWNLVLYLALGLGFLTKGPIIIILAALALFPYLAAAGRFREGLGRLADGWGVFLFLVLAASWPVPVLLDDPTAARVWYLEMGQKAGTAGITHHRHHEVLAVEWPMMTAPWVFLATTGALLPLLPRGRGYRPRVWFPWSWAIANLIMFCVWSVAKPNYYLPCLPGVALLVGLEWVRLTRAARAAAAATSIARRVLQLHWVLLFVAAAVAPVVARQVSPRDVLPIAAFSLAVLVAVVVSALAWRRGADAGALAPLVVASSLGVVMVYGVIAPRQNAARSHRGLAATLDHVLPADARTVMFYQEIDEGLWFYLHDRALVPVPGTQPRHNRGLDLLSDYQDGVLELDPVKRHAAETNVLVKWLADPKRPSSYVLIRKKVYESMAPALAGRAAPVLREQGLARNELILLRANPPGAVATGHDDELRR